MTTPSRGVQAAVVRVALVFVGLVVLVGAGAFLVPWAVTFALALLRGSFSGFVWVVQAFADGLDMWTILVRAGGSLGAALATPRVTLALVGAELVGVAALYGLHRVLMLEKEKTKW